MGSSDAVSEAEREPGTVLEPPEPTRRLGKIGVTIGYTAGTLRGEIGLRWQSSGRPRWDLEQTVRVAEECDIALESQGRNPAKKFRSLRKKGDRSYMDAYIRFYQFEWL